MLYVAKSPIQGLGVFTSEAIPPGTPVLNVWQYPVTLVSNAECYGVSLLREAGDAYLPYGDQWLQTSEPCWYWFFNHSFKPNLLYWMRIFYAVGMILPSTELVFDYETILVPGDSYEFVDAVSGRKLRGHWDPDVLKTFTDLMNRSLYAKPNTTL